MNLNLTDEQAVSLLYLINCAFLEDERQPPFPSSVLGTEERLNLELRAVGFKVGLHMTDRPKYRAKFARNLAVIDQERAALLGDEEWPELEALLDEAA